MLHSTRGIILKTFNYSENAVIAKIYTEKFGVRSYIIKGVSGKRRKAKKSLLQPLSLLNLVVYEKNLTNLQNIKELESAFAYKSIPLDIRKTSIVLFLNEIVYKSIGEEEPNQAMFDFIFCQMIKLDELEENITDFHTIFLMRFSKFLGFLPRNSYSNKNRYFDLHEGYFVSAKPFHNNFIGNGLSEKLSLVLSGKKDKIFSNASLRNELITKIIQYYALHVPAFGEIKSFPILKQVLE